MLPTLGHRVPASPRSRAQTLPVLPGATKRQCTMQRGGIARNDAAGGDPSAIGLQRELDTVDRSVDKGRGHGHEGTSSASVSDLIRTRREATQARCGYKSFDNTCSPSFDNSRIPMTPRNQPFTFVTGLIAVTRINLSVGLWGGTTKTKNTQTYPFLLLLFRGAAVAAASSAFRSGNAGSCGQAEDRRRSRAPSLWATECCAQGGGRSFGENRRGTRTPREAVTCQARCATIHGSR